MPLSTNENNITWSTSDKLLPGTIEVRQINGRQLIVYIQDVSQAVMDIGRGCAQFHEAAQSQLAAKVLNLDKAKDLECIDDRLPATITVSTRN